MATSGVMEVFRLFVCLLVVVTLTSVAEFIRLVYFQPTRVSPNGVEQSRGIAFYRYKYRDSQNELMRRLTRTPSTSGSNIISKETGELKVDNTNFLSRHERTQRQRRSHLQQACHKFFNDSLDIHQILAINEKSKESLVVDEKHNILFCTTPKVAGTSWLRVLNVLTGHANSTAENSGYETVDVARKLKRLASYTPSEIDHILKTYTKVMFSRHPLSRLLSAFSNKLAPNATDTRNQMVFRQAVGEIIQLMYHPCAYKRRRTRLKQCTYNVSFHDFVRYLLDPDLIEYHSNVHWRSNDEICKPCVINYDIIGKYETLLDDAKYVLRATKVDHLVSFPSKEGNSDTSTHSSDEEKLLDAYKQISPNELESLVHLYQMDFLLFDYPVAFSNKFAQVLNDQKTHFPSEIKVS